MRVYISADIEGMAGITAWEEARKGHGDYGEFRRQMTAEVSAACEGALAAGAEAITVKDAHGSARNLIAGELPPPTQLIRGWSGHPTMMVQDIDDSYDAALFVGYHARAAAGGNPLAHTMSSRKLQRLYLNGELTSEYRLHALACALHGVPVALVTGDAELAREVEGMNAGTRTFVTKWGEGPSQHSLHPAEAIDGVRRAAEEALGAASARVLELPERFELEIEYKDTADAYRRSFYPGAARVEANRVRFIADDYFEVLRALLFLVLV